MKLLKLGLRFWITLTSVASFVAGWIMLAHAPKPDQQNSAYTAVSSSTVPTLEPLPPLSDFNSSGNDTQSQPFSLFQPRQNFGFRPTFRTGGS
ncbi:MAG: hypothetical protein QM730_23935 [Anaerolineales bacterium]